MQSNLRSVRAAFYDAKYVVIPVTPGSGLSGSSEGAEQPGSGIDLIVLSAPRLQVDAFTVSCWMNIA